MPSLELAGTVTALLVGVFLSTATSGAPDRTGRLLDLVVDTLRPTAHR